MALQCNVFARAVNGQLQYRGTVEEQGATVWTGEWRSSHWKAEQDAELAARARWEATQRGKAVAQGKVGQVWPLAGEKW